MIEMILSNPVVLLAAAGIVYVLFFYKPKDQASGNQATPATSIGKGVVGAIEAKILQRASSAAAEHGLPILSDLLGTIARGDGANLTSIAENMAEQLRTPEGRRYVLGKMVRSALASFAKDDPSEFSAIAAEVNNRKKDIEDEAKRLAGSEQLKPQ